MVNSNDATLLDVLLERAAQNPDGVAYIFLQDGRQETARLTYRELAERSQLVAAHLVVDGNFGDRVILLIPSSIDFMLAYLGCLFAGRVPVPLPIPPYSKPLDRLLQVAQDCRAQLVLAVDEWTEGIRSALTVENIPIELKVWSIDVLLTEPGHGSALPGISPDDLCLLQYTSGSTARPRGVMVSHRNLLANLQVIYRVLRPDTHDKWVGWLPLFHDMGLIGQNLSPLYGGYPCVFMPPMSFIRRPLSWLEAITNYAGTTSTAPNFGYEICINKITPDQKTTLDLSSWHKVLNGAEPVRAQTLTRFSEQFRPCGFKPENWRPVYGLAENTLIVSGSEQTREPAIYELSLAALQMNRVAVPTGGETVIHKVGCGTVSEAQQVIIVSPETGIRCPPDQIGEIWISGPSVAQGYWSNQAASKETFQAYTRDGRGPYLRTGDLGFFAGRELVITGRIKDLIIIQGKNYYPQDIELIVEQAHPANRAGYGVAFSVDVGETESLVIVQEINRQAVDEFDGQQVILKIKQAVANEFGVRPHAVLLVSRSTIKKTSSGKKMRNACKHQFLMKEIQSLYEWRLSGEMG